MDHKEIDGNGWSEYQKLVLHELRHLNEKANKNIDEHTEIKTKLAELKVKSGL